MIKKEIITIHAEAWRSEDNVHKYVWRKQWYEGLKEDKTGKLALVITIRPTNTSAFTEDLTSLLIEKNIRKLVFKGFVLVNLFSSIHAKSKATFLKGSDENTFEVISTILKEKRIGQIIFACGSIVETNPLAMEQAKKIFTLLTAAQKEKAKLLCNGTTGKPAHPLSTQVRDQWVLDDVEKLFILE